jgi:hypothetical protein
LYSETLKLPNPRKREERSTRLRQAFCARGAMLVRRFCSCLAMRDEKICGLKETSMAQALLACPKKRRLRRCTRSRGAFVAGRARIFAAIRMLLKKFAREQRALCRFTFTRANQCK